MANTYNKIYLHIVFAVKHRKALLDKSWRPLLFAYIAQSLTKRGHQAIAVNGYHDHVHLLFQYSMKELVPDLVRELKKSSNAFIKEHKLSGFLFEWQQGYGAFSVSWHDVDKIQNYIKNQEEHHKKVHFKGEYTDMLKEYKVDYKDDYLFDFLE